MASLEEVHSDEGSELEFEEGLDEEYDTDDDEYQDDVEIEDGDEEDDEDDEDEEEDDDERAEQAAQYIAGLGPLPQRPQSTSKGRDAPNAVRPWDGLGSLPDATRGKYVDLLKRLKALEKKELTILLLGKHFAGKSATVNSLLNEDSARMQYLNRDSIPVTTHTREAHGLTLNIIDSGGPTELDFFSVQRMRDVAQHIDNKAVDVVLYVDRFDVFRTDGSDQQVIEGLTKFLGPSVWDNTVICLSRASNPTNGFSYEEFATKRSSKLRQAIRKYSGNQKAELPVALIENSDGCKKNEDREKVLPNGKAWLPELMARIVEVAETTKPYKYNKKAIERDSNPNKKLRWAVPLIFVAQLAIKKFILDPKLKDDYNTGDKNGPFEPNVVKGRRAIAQLEKKGEIRKGAARKQSSRIRRTELYDSDSD